MLLTISLLCCVSFVAGVVDSIAGGGGLLKLPALMLTGMTPQQAMGVNKLTGSLGTTAALLNFARSGLVPWKLALVGVPCALIGASVGSACIMMVPPETAGRILVVLLPIAAVLTLIPRPSRPVKETFSTRDTYIAIPLICFVVGFYDGFFGPGTGSFFIMAFHLFICMNLIRASALTKVLNLSSNVGSTVIFLIHGQVLFAYAIPMAFADILGNIVGSQLAMLKGSGIVKIFLVVSIVILIATLAWKYF